MSRVQLAFEAILASPFVKSLEKETAQVIEKTTGKAKSMGVTRFELSEGGPTYAAAYNQAHPGNTPVDDSFAVPAFAVEGVVYINTSAPDWTKEGVPNNTKIQSTLIHEYFHACSHGGTGLQACDANFGIAGGSICYADEMITDLYAYYIFTKMNLGDTFESGYLSKVGGGASSLAMGTAGGAWLSLAFALPDFDGKRLKIAQNYFHGAPALDAREVDLKEILKNNEKLDSTRNRCGLGWGKDDAAERIKKRIVDNGLEGLANRVDGYSIPTAAAGTLLDICEGMKPH